MKKNITGIVLTVSMAAVLGLTAFAGEATTEADKKIQFTTEDKAVTIELPNDEWKQIENKKVNEMLSDGDCEILISFYKADAELPARVMADDKFEAAFETTYSNDKFVYIVSALCSKEENFAEVKEAVDSIKIDAEKITDEMLEHKEIKKDEFTVKDENYTGWVSSKEGLNLRSGDSVDTSIIAFMPFRTKITVTGSVIHNGTDNGWKRVEFNGQVGYASGSFISTTEPQPEPETKPAPQPEPETEPEYMGHQFSGTDPWGQSISVTLRQVVDGELEWTYTEFVDNDKMIYRELKTPYTNGYTEWYIEGNVDDNMTYNYAGNLKLQGGGIEFTFTSGELKEGNPDTGESASHQVGPLMENGTNTIELTKAN